jgi:2',3'-cyclic-nucleotide 2'-phosphodiesterase (5'-nucleotidase family)
MMKKFLLEKLRFMLCFLGLFSFFFIGSSNAQLARKSSATSVNGAEISAFCPQTSRLFTVAGNAIEYYTLNSAGTLSSPTAIPYGLTLASGTTAVPNSVAVKNGVVAFGFAIIGANNAQLPGKVAFYDPLTATYISDVTVGYLPDMIAFSPDGTKILTANEGEPNSYNQVTSFDPEGSISIIDISAGVANATVREASFTSFNSDMATLKAAGVRIYGPNATVAQDLEPEYVTFIDNATAAVTLQENNAVAMVDIATGTVTSINPLGLKDHSIAGNGFDASDRDLTSTTGKINIQSWPVKGMYMPDAIASFTSGGNNYFITANEGDSRDYTGFSEEVRVGATGATGYTLDATVFPTASTLKTNANLGRLQLTRATGDTDGDGDFDEIHALGARSFTIWNNTFAPVFDSGDQLEQITATQNAAGFNSDGVVGSGFDSRSDNKGPEPEGVVTGMVNGVQYAFVGSERTGDIFMYDITNPTAPVFKQYINTAADLGVEGLVFVPAAESPTGNALVIVSAEVSKTISVYEFTPSSVNLAVSTNTASETAGTVVTVTATASEPVFGDKTVSVAISGTDVTAADYTLSNATITIPSGATTGSVTFTVLSDNAVETLETATVTISNPSSGIALGTTTTQDIAISDFVFTLQVLHASDFEGAVEAVQDAPRFAAIVDQLEESHVNTIKLSSGDNYIPGPFLSSGGDPTLAPVYRTAYENFYNRTFTSSVNLGASIGRADISILNFIGIEASALGNHEFDLGTNEIRTMIAGANTSSASITTWYGAQFPYLSSNLNFSGDSNLSSIATTDRLRLNTSFMSSPTETPAVVAAKTKLAPSTIVMKGGQKIGIVGCTTQILASISAPGATTGTAGNSNNMALLATVVQPVVNALIADGCNKIILLSHLQQIAFEKDLATRLTGVDIIIAAGSNTLLADANDRLRAGDVAVGTYPFLATDLAGRTVPVVNTDGNYKYVGRLVVDFDSAGNLLPSSINDAISGVYAADEQGLNDVWGANVANAYAVGTRGYQVKLLCDAIGNVINQKDGNLFGKTAVFLEGRRNFVRTEETNLGNLTAEANLWMAKQYDPTTVISFKNGGGIRSAIGNVIAVGDDVTLAPPIANAGANKQSGDISQLDIENSLRFNNQLSLVTLTASGLRSILEHAVAGTTATATPGQFAQVAGVRYSYNFTNVIGSRILNAVVTDADGNVIDTLVVNGVTQGDLTRTFRVVTLNFLAGGGDSYPFVALSTNRVNLDALPEVGPAMAAFTNAGSEQDAFAEYMKSQFSTTPYGIADTSLVNDCRIQGRPANAGTNSRLQVAFGTTVTAAQLFASLDGRPQSGGTWSPSLAGAGVYTYTVTVGSCQFPATATVTVSETIPTILNFCPRTTVATAVGATSLKLYTAATTGTALDGTTVLTSRILYATQTVGGVESTPRVPVFINLIAIPSEVVGAITSNTPSTTAASGFAAATLAVSQFVGTSTTVSYRIPAFVGSGLTYLWKVPAGVNIVGQATGVTEIVQTGSDANVLNVNFANIASGAGVIGAISVQAVNASGCAGTAKSITVSKVLPTAPTAIRMTRGSATAITSFAPYIGTNIELTLTATPAATASSYVWELPEGVNVTNSSATNIGGVISSTSNVITVNFAGVTSTNTFNYMVSTVSTNNLRIGVRSLNGTGLSTTSNTTLTNSSASFYPNNTSMARLLTLTAVRAAAPSSLRMFNTAVSPTAAVTDISRFIGTSTAMTLVATPSAFASSYTWEVPSTVNVIGGDITSNTIIVDFANVPAGTTAFYIGVKAINGIGSSITNNSALTLPTTTSDARLLKVTARAPYTPSTVAGSLAICSTIASNVTYTIATAALGANTYNVTVPVGCTINGGITNTASIEATAGATFTVNYPAAFVANATTAIRTISIQSVNGFGVSTTNRVLRLTNIGAVCTSSARKADPALLSQVFEATAFPVPSFDVITVEIQSSSKEVASVQVYDMQGRLMDNFKSNTTSFELGRNYATGVYNVIVSQGTNVKTLRVIKK